MAPPPSSTNEEQLRRQIVEVSRLLSRPQQMTRPHSWRCASSSSSSSSSFRGRYRWRDHFLKGREDASNFCYVNPRLTTESVGVPKETPNVFFLDSFSTIPSTTMQDNQEDPFNTTIQQEPVVQPSNRSLVSLPKLTAPVVLHNVDRRKASIDQQQHSVLETNTLINGGLKSTSSQDHHYYPCHGPPDFSKSIPLLTSKPSSTIKNSRVSLLEQQISRLQLAVKVRMAEVNRRRRFYSYTIKCQNWNKLRNQTPKHVVRKQTRTTCAEPPLGVRPTENNDIIDTNGKKTKTENSFLFNNNAQQHHKMLDEDNAIIDYHNGPFLNRHNGWQNHQQHRVLRDASTTSFHITKGCHRRNGFNVRGYYNRLGTTSCRRGRAYSFYHAGKGETAGDGPIGGRTGEDRISTSMLSEKVRKGRGGLYIISSQRDKRAMDSGLPLELENRKMPSLQRYHTLVAESPAHDSTIICQAASEERTGKDNSPLDDLETCPTSNICDPKDLHIQAGRYFTIEEADCTSANQDRTSFSDVPDWSRLDTSDFGYADVCAKTSRYFTDVQELPPGCAKDKPEGTTHFKGPFQLPGELSIVKEHGLDKQTQKSKAPTNVTKSRDPMHEDRLSGQFSDAGTGFDIEVITLSDASDEREPGELSD